MEEQSEQPAEVPPEPEITVDCDCSVDVLWLRAKVQTAAAFLKIEKSTISIRIVDDATMSQLHQKYSGVKGTTDVLTFDHGSTKQAIDVDIAVCFDVASRAAQARGHEVDRELLLYVIHGILHCTGFDDHDEGAHQRIHCEEDRVLQAIGVGATWSSNR